MAAGRDESRQRLASLLGRSMCLIVLAAFIAGCASTGGEKNAAPEYAATPRKALESWVTAVRESDTEMMCRLLHPRSECDERLVETSLLPRARAEMRGLKGDIGYGAIRQSPRSMIGVVTGDSPSAYAVKVFRGITQWVIAWEELDLRGVAPIVLERPDPATVLASGRTAISFLASADTPGSVYPNAELWIDSRHVDGGLSVACPCGDIADLREDCKCPTSPRRRDPWSNVETLRWFGAPRLLPGRHVMVAAVRTAVGGLDANAWVLTVR
jgi:hypothetical protein